MKKTIALLSAIATLALCLSAPAFPTNTFTKSLTFSTLSPNEYADMKINLSAFEDRLCTITYDESIADAYGMVKVKSATTTNVFLALNTDEVTISGSTLSFWLRRTNSIPNGVHNLDIVLMNNTSTNLVRSGGQGKVVVKDSQFDDVDGTWQSPAFTNLADYLTTVAAAGIYQPIATALVDSDIGVTVQPYGAEAYSGTVTRVVLGGVTNTPDAEGEVDLGSAGAGDLVAANNLSDLASIPAAATNLTSGTASIWRTLLGLVIGTDVLAPDGDGSGLSGVLTNQSTDFVAVTGDTMTGQLNMGTNDLYMTKNGPTQWPGIKWWHNGIIRLSITDYPSHYLIRQQLNLDGSVASTYKIWDEQYDGTGSGLDADMIDGEHASAFQDASAPLDALSVNNGGSVTNLAAANIPYYNGVQVITSAALISLLPTKTMMELTLSHAPTITMNASALRQPYMLTIFGTNTVTMGSQFSLAGTWTQTGTNILSIFPRGQTTNWVYGVVTQ